MAEKRKGKVPDSLVKYATEVWVSSGYQHGEKKKDASAQPITNSTQTQDILNKILPPIQPDADKSKPEQMWIQCVSPTPATRADVIQLQERLDARLQQRQARETGICPIREELFAQCFDELIRQITINCAERGLLLVRVRDEIKQTVQTYQTLYESQIAFGMKKVLYAEQKRNEMNAQIKQLEGECADLQKQVESIERNIDDMQRINQEQYENDERAHKDQVKFLENTKKIQKEELEKFLSGDFDKKQQQQY